MDDYAKKAEVRNRMARDALRPLKEGRGAAIDKAQITACLRECIEIKYQIHEKEETNFYKLAVISLKTQEAAAAGLSEAEAKRMIKQYDCHQVSLAARMKILFLMFVEKELGLSFDDQELTDAETLEEFAELVRRQLEEVDYGSVND